MKDDYLNPDRIRHAVRMQAVSSSATAYPIAIGLLLGAAAAVFRSPVVGWLGAGAVLTGASAFVFNLIGRRVQLERSYTEKYKQHLEELRRKRLAGLREMLEEEDVYEGLRQLDSFIRKFETLQAVLRSKLDAEEMTHQRYFATAQEVFLAGLDNLRKIAIKKKTANSIDFESLQQRIQEADDVESSAVSALIERRDLYLTTLTQLQELLTQNEHALTALDLTMSKLSEANLETGETEASMEVVMEDLVRLAHQTQMYEV